MVKRPKRYIALLLSIVLVLSLVGVMQAQAESSSAKKVYEVTWSSEDLSTPMNWVQSQYFNNPLYKETRFEIYWPGTPIPPGGPRETSFYMVYKEDGLYMFIQSNEPETDANGKLKESSLELFIVPSEGDLPYHQMIVPTGGGPIEYYEWQTEYRDNRPLKGNVRVNTGQIPSGWGTVIVIPWENVYDSVPLDGGSWQFNLIRWSPSDGQTWGGHVHQPGKFNQLHFQAPSAEQRIAIQKHLLANAWNKFQSTAAQLTDYWSDKPATKDQDFYNRFVLPLIIKGSGHGAQMDQLDELNADEIDELYGNVSDWMELRYNVDDQRLAYLKKGLTNQHTDQIPPTTRADLDGTNGSGDWYVSDVTVSLLADDDDSGVASSEYALTVTQSTYGRQSTDGFVPYTSPIVLSEGVYELLYRSTDKAGNIEEAKHVAVQIDKTAPTFSVLSNGDVFGDNVQITDSQPVTLTLQTKDNLSGVAAQTVTVDGNPYIPGTELNWAGNLGTHTVRIVVKDHAGNATQTEIAIQVYTDLASMGQLLQRYAESGQLTGPLQKQLANKYGQALDQFNKGHLKQAIKHMEDFLEHINQDSMQEHITAEAKAVLIADANTLITSWSQGNELN